jgi:hypothetical protein
MKTKKPEQVDVSADMSDEAIDRRLRDVAQLYRLGIEMQSARLTKRKATSRDNAKTAASSPKG